jgi:hypothetical protein
MGSTKTIPMSTEELQDLFLNPAKSYVIDLKNSKLKGEAFITYISNMKMKCSLLKDTNLTKEEKYDTLSYFFQFSYPVDCDTLIETSAFLFLRYRNVPVDFSFSWLSIEDMDEYIALNKPLFEKVSKFMDSLILGVSSFNNDFKKDYLEPAIESGEIEVIDDANLFSVNMLGMLTVPNFLEYFIGFSPLSETVDLKYYRHQMEQMTYNKKSLFEVFANLKEDSLILSLVNVFFSEKDSESSVLNKYPQLLGVI